MDFQIAALLMQDGLTNGAIYALMALALVLVFAVTRVIFIPQGEFVAYGTLTLATLQLGHVPGTVWLLLLLGLIAAAVEATSLLRAGRGAQLPRAIGLALAVPIGVAILTLLVAPQQPGLWLQLLLTLIIVTPLGPLLYRIVYQPIADASVLVLLIVSVAVHFALLGLGLVFFGAEGSRTPAFSEGSLEIGAISMTAQSLWVLAASALLIAAMFYFFEYTIYGKALRATAFNRIGARLIGFSPKIAGALTFTLAALIGAFSGILVGPITTIYYDSGFLIGLKGFVGAIIGGLVSYPLAAAGAILVGLLEAFASFWASEYKEVIVFTLIIPVLLWRSLTAHHVEEDEQ
jgi:branched-subunit amino acid ABC-type transport system permease component